MKYLPLTSALSTAILAVFLTSACIKLPETTAFNSTLPRTEINGYAFHTEVYGNAGPVVIIVHGGPGAYFSYLRPLTALSDRYRVVFYDQRGTGLSPRENRDGYTIEEFVRDLDGMVDRYSGGKQVRLIGHSWGAMLVTAYAAQHPDKVSHAVIVEPGMLNKEAAREFSRRLDESSSFLDNFKLLWYLAGSLFVESRDGHEKKDYVMTKILESAKGAPYFCKGERLPENGGSRAGFSSFEAMMLPIVKDPGRFNYNLNKGIEEYKGKLLLVSSGCSFIGYEFQEKYHKPLLPLAARHVKIEDTGHYLLTMKTEESLRIIREFFKQ